jgi:hypothetical protein
VQQCRSPYCHACSSREVRHFTGQAVPGCAHQVAALAYCRPTTAPPPRPRFGALARRRARAVVQPSFVAFPPFLISKSALRTHGEELVRAV